MSGTFKLVKEFMSALNASEQNKTQPYDTQGTVKRVEGDTAWVQLTGSDRETPIQMTIACDVGDTVQARIGGGSAWLTGNLTAPPTDDKKANEAISMVTNVIETVEQTVDEALEDVSTVDDVTMQYCLSDSSSTFVQYGDWSNAPPTYVSGKYYWTRTVLYDEDGNPTYGTPQYSQDTQLSVETDVAFKSNNNHFWHDTSGAYVTTANKNYSSGYATRITSSGILQSYNNNLLSGWTNSGIAFYAGDGTTASASTVLADFGTSGMNVYAGGTSVASFGSVVRLGATTNASYTEVNATGLDVKDTSSGDKLSVDASGILGFVGSNSAWGIYTYTPTVGTNYGIYIRSRAGQSITITDDISLNGTVHIDAVEPTTLFNVTSISLDQYEGLTGSGNIAGSTTVTNGGYYPLGVVGLSIATGGAYSRGAYLSNESTGSCTVNIRVYNTGSGSVTATAYILWVAA